MGTGLTSVVIFGIGIAIIMLVSIFLAYSQKPLLKEIKPKENLEVDKEEIQEGGDFEEELKFSRLQKKIGVNLTIVVAFEKAPQRLLRRIGVEQWVDIYRKSPENSNVKAHALNEIKFREDSEFDKRDLISWYFQEGAKSNSIPTDFHEAILGRIKRLNREVDFWLNVCSCAEYGRYHDQGTYYANATFLDSSWHTESVLYEIEKGGILSKKLFNLAIEKISEVTTKFGNNFELWWSFWEKIERYLKNDRFLEKKRYILCLILNGLFNTASRPREWARIYERFLRESLYAEEFPGESRKFEKEVLQKLAG